MTPEESLRLKCLQLAIETRGYSRAGVDLISAATAIEDYVTGKHAEMTERLMRPVEFSASQEEAVRNIVAEQLATMFTGADRRIRSAVAGIDRSRRAAGFDASVDEAPAGPRVTPTVAEVLEKLQPVSPPADHLDPRPLAGNPA